MKHILLLLTFLCAILSYAQEPEGQLNPISVSSPEPVLLIQEDSVTIQIDEVKKTNSFLSHLSVGVRTSTMGVGLELATPVNDYLKLRTGINFIGYKSSTFDIGLDDSNGLFDEAFGYTPDYKMNGELNFTNGHLLMDFHPTKGIFHVTAGVFIGTNKLKANGFLANPNTGDKTVLQPGAVWPSVDFDGYQLELDNADLNAELQLGRVIKPYFGLGLGRAIANKRVAFKFELGMIYQGDYSIKQNGKKIDIANTTSESFSDIDTYTRILRWWPMLNFQLSYKIF